MNFDLLASLIHPKSIMDIGANKADFHNNARLNWLQSYFVLVEANPDCEPFLKATGAEYYIQVLSDRVREVQFFSRKGSTADTGDSYYREKTPFYSDENLVTRIFQATTLDLLFLHREFELLKLDVQGAELDILRGGPVLVSKANALLLEIPLEEYNEGAPTKKEIEEYVRSLGFSKDYLLGDIVHPINRNVIQQDILYVR
jgi:FkbM family methyltransferase